MESATLEQAEQRPILTLTAVRLTLVKCLSLLPVAWWKAVSSPRRQCYNRFIIF